MFRVLLLACVGSSFALVTPAASSAPKADVGLVLDLADGSRIVGTSGIDRLKLSSGYATMEISLPMIRAVELSGSNGDARISMKNGDVLTARLLLTRFEVKTCFGQAVIPVSFVKSIHPVPGTVKSDLPSGLVLHFTFDTDEGDHVTDQSDAGNNGKVVGATFTEHGKIGGGMYFDGDRQLVNVGNPSSLQLQDLTIMTWFKRDSTDRISKTGIWGEFFGYGEDGYVFGMLNTGQIYLSKVGVSEIEPDLSVTDTGFHHYAVTRHGSHVVFYLDGVAYPASDYGEAFEFNTEAAVGGRTDNAGGSLEGVIDEVAVFNRALSGDEIKKIYDSQK